MKIGVLGTGMVGETIASKLIALKHSVIMGSRTVDNPKAVAWVKKNGENAAQGTFTDAAAFAEIIFNCTSGVGSIDALKQAGEKNLNAKICVDISNPLDFSKGMPPSLTICNTDSLGEQIQRTFPETKVIKTLNTVNCKVMVDPALVPGVHDMLLCGNDDDAKKKVTEILQKWFGWKSVIDIGDITGARVTEMYVPLWVRMFGVLGTPNFNFHYIKG